MNRVSICIATYKRPEMLNSLLISILETSKDPSLIKSISIFVVDNDNEGSSKHVVEHFSSSNKTDFEIYYEIEPQKGISNVRNRLVTNSLKHGGDFMIFIDDDEFVTLNWLNEMVGCAKLNNADVVIGPVIPVFEKNTPDYISYWFNRSRYPDNSTVETLQTGNLLMRLSMLMDKKVWFDTSGSEDTKKGIPFYWSEKQLLCRVQFKWLKRIYRANTYTYSSKLRKTSRMIKWLVWLTLVA
jgi:GT2 family glycosyltransferase